jgi:hypothetical protein
VWHLQFSGGRRRVDALVETHKRYAERLEILEQRDGVLQVAAEPEEARIIPAPLALAPHTLFGDYEINGDRRKGTGQVYRVIEAKLKRRAAFKILTPSAAGDADHFARFQREAGVLASLNHRTSVEGEDLAQRTMRCPIPLGEALLITKQIAEALEAAHEPAITHRDLRPANIKVCADGIVKVTRGRQERQGCRFAACGPASSGSPSSSTTLL